MAGEETTTTTTTSTDTAQRAPGVIDYQCFFNDFMGYFADLKGTQKGQAYRNIILVDTKTLGSDASNFLNKTVDSGAQLLFENLPREVLANLQPEIKLYKVVYSGPDDKKGTSIPLPINNFGDPRKAGYYGRSPGFLAGTIKEFSWDYLGTNPAEVDYYINCKLKLWFASKDAMFHTYKIAGKQVSFADLIRRPVKFTGTGEDGHRIFNHSFFRIRVDVQYPRPTSEFVREACRELKISRSRLLRAIRGAKVSFFLNILKHDFNLISDVPSQPFEVEITYNGAVESALWDPTINLLRPKDVESTHSILQNQDAYILLQKAEQAAREAKVYSVLQEKGVQDFLPPSSTQTAKFKTALAGHGGYDLMFQEGRTVGGYKVKSLHNAYSWAGRTTTYTANAPTGGWRKARQKQYDSTLGQDYNVELEKVILNYYKAKYLVDRIKLSLGISDNQLKSHAYGRILEELYGDNPQFQHGNRMYTRFITWEKVMQWMQRGKETVPDNMSAAEYKEIQKQAESGEPEEVRKAAQEKLKQIRKDRQAADALFAEEFITGGGLGRRQSSESAERKTGRQVQLDLSEFNKLKEVQSGPGRKLSKKEEKKLKQLEKRYGTRERKLNPHQGRVPGDGMGWTFTWMYFGDLIDVAIDIIRDMFGNQAANLDFWSATENRQGRTRIILGDVEYFDVRTNKKKTISLAKVPISLQLFNEWWFNLVIKPQKEKLSFRQFLQSAMSGLIQEAFTTHCSDLGDRVNNVRTNIDFFTIRPDSPKKVSIRMRTPGGTADAMDKAYYATIGEGRSLAKRIVAEDEERQFKIRTLPIAAGIAPTNPLYDQLASQFELGAIEKVEKTLSVDKEQEIFFIYCTSNLPGFLNQGKLTTQAAKRKDIANGVLYLEVGVDGTPVKDISFKKVDIPFYNESRGERAGFKNNALELSNVYNLSFKTIGNTSLRPGRHIYVRLPHFGNPQRANSESRILGIGGYYMVNKVNNSIIADGRRVDWETEVEALWQAFGGEAIPSVNEQDAGVTAPPAATPNAPLTDEQKRAAAIEDELRSPDDVQAALDQLQIHKPPGERASNRVSIEGVKASRQERERLAEVAKAKVRKRDHSRRPSHR